MNDYAEARLNMIDRQLRPNKICAQPVIDAFLRVDRDLFVPPALRRAAYLDTSLPLGQGRGLIDPTTLGRLVQAAAIEPQDRVLVVGANRGYEVALLASMAAVVVGLECDPALAAAARENLTALDPAYRVLLVEGPHADGVSGEAPFDVILVAGAIAGALGTLLGQLAAGGRLVAVIAGAASLMPVSATGAGALGVATLYRRVDGVIGSRALFEASVPTVPGFPAEGGFAF